MTKRAWAYYWLIFLSGVFLILASFSGFDPATQPWTIFAILTGLATIAQLFKSEAPTHQLYHPTLVFTFAGVLLLHPAAYALMVIVYHLIEWVKERLLNSPHLRDWYLQPFNISMHILAGLSAGFAYRLINPNFSSLFTNRAILSVLIAAAIYVLLNHLVLGQILVLARGVSWRESEILSAENLSIDFIILMMGFVTAILAKLNAWLVFPALTPLYLIYRALAVPILKQQANTDAKTGLWNAQYFISALETELSRANRFGRPLAVVVADLDLLRNINNAYGHLAGDAVLIGTAKILKEQFRDYDVVSRFGGEEFAILMPETTQQYAYARIEKIRLVIENAEFEAPTTHIRIKATMSFGVAGPGDPQETAKEIIHHADVAVYEAKTKGRNQSVIFSKGSAFAQGLFNKD